VTLLEARDRLGGRIYTQQMPHFPVELGAEFVHGRPKEILGLAAESRGADPANSRQLSQEDRRRVGGGRSSYGEGRPSFSPACLRTSLISLFNTTWIAPEQTTI